MPTALLSVYDKAGIVDLARGLHELGWTLLSSGGTARVIADADIPVTDVAEITGLPAILGHRVVTLHPKVHGGILADPDDPDHRRDLEDHDITPISLVVVNLYPFASDPGIDLIDIGGPAMVRAAAKNHAHVGVVVDPADYGPVLAELREGGRLSASTRRRLATAAFARTAAYDAEIVAWLDDEPAGAGPGEDADGGLVLPATLDLRLERVQDLRYGENPHQVAARYRRVGASGWWDTMVQHGGKELSFLNLFDAEAAWRLVQRFDEPACVIVKHANPCGVAVDADITTAYERAHACDPVSAFGGIVALNRPMPLAAAKALAPVFTEVVVAPGYDDDALATLTAKTQPARADGAAARRAGARRAAGRRRVARAATRPGGHRPQRVVGRHGDPADRRSSGTTCSSPGRCALPSARTPSCSPRTARRSASGPGSRTASTRPASPPTGPATGPSAASAPATPTSRSATASTWRPRPASRRSSSPAAASGTPRSSRPPTSTAWRWCSPASGTSGTDRAASRGLGMTRFAESRPVA